MKLTKQKLEQLILQEMKYYRPPEFDPRAPKKYPEYAEKFSDLYKKPENRESAKLNADVLDHSIDVETPETDEPDEQHLSFGIQQFRQESPATYHGIHSGNVEIYFHTQEQKWFVYYFLTNPYGAFTFNSELSREFSNAEEAISYYNNHADNKYDGSKPLMDRAEYGETAARNKLKKSI